ncbi:phosphoribosylanthranilate isomerase [Aestuariispira ectoiniformans]|uniref:phosphoribosylanthranilate isomerase n=1 Tax=Aestuariispira ectoiniformans TaxID=2775080 RepID=UPI00223BE129|nr:phosphoribosylanthranilate isomerase [Aestuariispira ectoiniformans]
MTTAAKICGITTPDALDAAVKAGAAHVGFVFFPPSPRSITTEEAAILAARLPVDVNAVGLFVDPDDGLIDRVLEAVPLDIIQLHGKESPERVAAIKARTGRAVMKAVHIREAEDLEQVPAYEEVSDWILFDAKPPKDAKLPGGNAVAFDWTLLENQRWRRPWMLAGGLTPDNVVTAIRLTGAPCVDTSSGVEDAPGQKSPHKIQLFLEKVKSI